MRAQTPPTIVVVGCDFPTTLVRERVFADRIGATLLDDRQATRSEIERDLARADAVLSELYEFDADTIALMARCRVLSMYAIGTDTVDLAAATEAGIVVTNAPEYCVHEVAEHTFALLLAVWRRLPRSQQVAASDAWTLEPLRPIHRLHGRVLGLVGFGRIARAVAARAQAFGMRVHAYDPYVAAEVAAEAGALLVDLEELLSTSDVLSVHLPLTDETRGLLDRSALRRMRPGAVLVNASRGGVVDEAALADAIASGLLMGVGLDVRASEPPGANGHQLLPRIDDVYTPHMGYYSEEALEDLAAAAIANLEDVLAGTRPSAVVNPEVYTRRAGVRQDMEA